MRLPWLVGVGALLLSCCSRASPDLPQRLIIDSHVHLSPDPESVERALRIFERNGIGRFCVKSAGHFGSSRFRATLELKRRLGDRLAFFSNPDFGGVDRPDFGEGLAKNLEAAVRAGARGIKIFKALGLYVRRADGTLLAPDDPALEPLWQKAGELGAIVAWHVADPRAFFQAPTPDNERYLELLFAPGWGFYGKDFPAFDTLLAAAERVIAAHPKTTFLLIHLGCDAENLEHVDRMLRAYPNLYTDTSARVPEFGRHPAEAVREFFLRHQDRILFGSDIVIGPGELQLGSLSIWPDTDEDADVFYRAHREYFETDHKALATPTPIQGAWRIDGIHLPEEVLEKLYVKNAERLIWKQ